MLLRAQCKSCADSADPRALKVCNINRYQRIPRHPFIKSHMSIFRLRSLFLVNTFLASAICFGSSMRSNEVVLFAKLTAVEEALLLKQSIQISPTSFKAKITPHGNTFLAQLSNDEESEYSGQRSLRNQFVIRDLLATLRRTKPILKQKNFDFDQVFLTWIPSEGASKFPTIILRFFNDAKGLKIASVGEDPLSPQTRLGFVHEQNRSGYVQFLISILDSLSDAKMTGRSFYVAKRGDVVRVSNPQIGFSREFKLASDYKPPIAGNPYRRLNAFTLAAKFIRNIYTDPGAGQSLTYFHVTIEKHTVGWTVLLTSPPNAPGIIGEVTKDGHVISHIGTRM